MSSQVPAGLDPSRGAILANMHNYAPMLAALPTHVCPRMATAILHPRTGLPAGILPAVDSYRRNLEAAARLIQARRARRKKIIQQNASRPLANQNLPRPKANKTKRRSRRKRSSLFSQTDPYKTGWWSMYVGVAPDSLPRVRVNNRCRQDPVIRPIVRSLSEADQKKFRKRYRLPYDCRIQFMDDAYANRWFQNDKHRFGCPDARGIIVMPT